MKKLVATTMFAAVSSAALLGACSSSEERKQLPATLRWDLPDTSEGLVNVSADLNAVLENGALQGACERYRAGAKDRKTMLLCGKWMFFYEGFDTMGAPKVMITGLMKHFPDQTGPGFSKMGMFEDPTSPDHLPIGFGKTVPLGGKVEALAFTCASCHFGRLPDGRYAVGAPNHDYEYGKQNLALITLTPLLMGGDPSTHDAAAVAMLKPFTDYAAAHPTARDEYVAGLKDLVSLTAGIPPMPAATEHAYATWKTGTLDAIAAPSPYEDNVNGVTKIPAIWAMPNDDEIRTSGMAHAMIGWTGVTPNFMAFARGFISLFPEPGQTKPNAWTEEQLQPFYEYVHSLRAPLPAKMPEPSLVDRGAKLFAEKGCADCHRGPRGSGLHVFKFEEIGTDDTLKRTLDPQLTGKPCCGYSLPDGVSLSHGIKAPRLAGLWTMKRFLHNGAVDSLEDLFCMKGPRGKITEPSYRDSGHDFTCNGLSNDEKTALIGYLSAH